MHLEWLSLFANLPFTKTRAHYFIEQRMYVQLYITAAFQYDSFV